jgi:hypothetical protein
MKFRWISKSSDVAAATMVVARVFCQGQTVDQAIDETLSNGKHCRFPDRMPARERARFRLMVEERLNKTKERRQMNDQENRAYHASA